jgi:beta-aspartyl-peptidase (threonine type)
MNNHCSPILVVHGGAWEIPPKVHQAHVDGCSRAAAIGWSILVEGGTALDAVEAAVRCLEDDTTYDAGRGSFLNAAGEVELDAMIMDGRDLNLGAVAAVRNIRNPVTLARRVMTASEHTFFVGPGAESFARQQGIPACSPQDLLVERELERWRDMQAGIGPRPSEYFIPRDTVGAVALDAAGNLAAATSTGGSAGKLPGRVGDSPLVGSGAYADNRSAAASATGVGEALMKIVISKTACDLVAQGHTAQEAADAAIALLAERTDGHGGLIVLDRQGRFGISHNTSCIAHAVISEGRSFAGMSYGARTGGK